MHHGYKAIILFSTLVLLSLSANLHSYENIKESFSGINEIQANNADEIIFFPRIGLGLDVRTFTGNDAGCKMESYRIIDIEALRIKNFAFFFYVNEFLIFNNARRYYLKPYSINYTMDYGTFRWDSRYGIFSIFFDHNCSNIFNENKTNSRQLRWYGAGMRWESYGMQTGRKDIKINFNDYNKLKFIGSFNYRLSIGRKIHTRAFNYDYLITGNLRYDILNYYFLIPFLEGSFTSLIDDRLRFNRSLEAGIRMHFDKGDLIPFAGISHKHDIDYYNGNEANLYYFGFTMETLLGDVSNRKPGIIKSAELSFPDFHFSGSYGKYINNDKLNYNTNIFIGVNFANPSQVTPFFSSRLIHNSQKASAGMFPRYMQTNLEAGLSYMLKLINTLIEPYYGYFRYDESNYYHGHIEEFSTLGLRIKNKQMNNGCANNGIDFNNSMRFEWINRIDWMISAQRIVKESHYKYTYEYTINLKWNIFRYKIIIPYLSAEITLLNDENYDKVYNIEHGVRFQNGLYWMLFYKYEYRTSVEPDNGIFRDYHLLGIRFEI